MELEDSKRKVIAFKRAPINVTWTVGRIFEDMKRAASAGHMSDVY